MRVEAGGTIVFAICEADTIPTALQRKRAMSVSIVFDVLCQLKQADSREKTRKFKVAVLGVVPDASGTVPASGARHLPHLHKPQECAGPTKVLMHTFNVLRNRLPVATPYAELSKNQEQETTVSGDGHHLLQRQTKIYHTYVVSARFYAAVPQRELP